MGSIIAAINMTIDGYCDHDIIAPDEAIHRHYEDMLRQADVILYGRITYQLMQYWQDLLENPSEDASLNDFAKAIDQVPKIVFSHQLKSTGWDSAELATQPLENVVRELKQQRERKIYVGSRSLINELLNLDLIDEFQLCIHPVIAGKGLPLFSSVRDKKIFKLAKTKQFDSGAIILCYERA